MLPVQRKRAKEICHESSKLSSTMQTGRLASVFLRFSLLSLIFLNRQTSGEGLHFCFDGPKEGYRLNSTVIKYVHAHTGVECVLICQREDKCRSINFRKTSNCDKNCELLRDVHSEKPDLLLKDDQFDYYLLLDPNRKPPEPVSTSTPPQITQKSSSTIMNHSTCSNANWWKSFDAIGWSKCGKDNLFITGFYRNHPYNDSDPITLLEEARCCTSIPEFSEQNGTCTTANWWHSLDNNNQWSLCPSGYFLNGLYRFHGILLQNIEQGYCCRPSNHPDRYGLCYDEDVGVSFDREGLSNCSKPEYYITGVYRGSGANWLNNIDKFRCCQMALAEGSTTQPTTNQELLSSCKELLQRNRSLSNGVYQLRNTDSLEQYQVYCHMTELSGCGQGGWTLVMKVDGNKNDFNYSSPYWTNKETYAVEDGLQGLNEKQTKLASYWNTPFNKICLGMKVNGATKWIALNYTTNSLHSVIEDGTFKGTTFGKEAWKSLIDGSSLQENCNEEGFNIQGDYKYDAKITTWVWYMNIRIGLVANNENNCDACDSCIGFGTSISGCWGDVRSTTCGNMAVCAQLHNKNTAAFGYILVH